MIPDIADHAVYGRGCAGGQRRVADDGLGIGMQVMGIGINHSLIEQMIETPVNKVLAVAG